MRWERLKFPHAYYGLRRPDLVDFCWQSSSAFAYDAATYLKKCHFGVRVGVPDYYEFLQISPSAEPETIHRVYRFMAARLHPDNQETGDAEKFHLLQAAYEVLSDPERRATYDAARRTSEAPPLSTWIDFMDHLEGELNRRLAVLAILYFQRRTNPYSPEVPLHEIETRLGFPRDYLEFTSWYLRTKGYILRADNSDFTITAEGVDFVETQRVHIPVLNRLLTTGEASAGNGNHAGNGNGSVPVVLPNLVSEVE